MTFNAFLKNLLILLSLSLASLTAIAEINLTLDRNNIREKETFQLVINVEQDSSLNAGHSLQFLPDSFTVLNTQRFQKSTVVNNKLANQKGWVLLLVSKEAGTFSLPAFQIGSEQSQPFTIRILPALDDLEQISPNSKIKLKAHISNEQIYVQQQLIYTIRAYSSVETRRPMLTPLQVENALVKRLSERAEFQLVHNGTRYNVLEEKYVVFPQKSGDLLIPRLTFRTNMVNSSASFGSLSRYKPVELRSQPFTVEVKPKPETAESPWIPAHKLELSASWQPAKQQFEVGSPASLDFVIDGVGLLPEQLPTVSFPDVDGVKIYRDKPNLQSRVNRFGANSYHFEKIVLIPNKAGTITIPEIKVPYWNTKSDQQEYATLEAMSFEVKEQATASQLAPIQQAPIDNNPPPSLPATQESSSYWKILAIVFASLWLLTVLLLGFKKTKPQQPQRVTRKISKQQPISQQITLAQLKKVCRSANPTEFKKQLFLWAKPYYPNTTKLTMQQLISRSQSPALKTELQRLDKACNASYSSDKTAIEWNGSQLSELLSEFDFIKSGKKPPVDKLAPLYPNNGLKNNK